MTGKDVTQLNTSISLVNKLLDDLADKRITQIKTPIKNELGVEFVLINSGTFIMESPEDEPDREYDEQQHDVTLGKGFYMQTTVVTQGQWESAMGTKPWLKKQQKRILCAWMSMH